MKIYFRYDGSSLEYSLYEFDKEDSCKYSEFSIGEDYNYEEACSLCEKMIYEYETNGMALETTLETEIIKRNNLLEAIKYFDKFKVNFSKNNTIHLSVYLVYKGNFNDEMLVESLVIKIDDIKDKELVWYDVYLNKKRNNTIRIAPVYLEGNDLYFLENNNDKIRVVKKNDFIKYYSEDYDDKYIITTKVYCSY